MIEFIIIALIGSLAAGIWDLKTTNIPDLVVIGMIILGLALHVASGFLLNDFSTLLSALFFGGIFLVFGYLMYKGGQWGGGDGELLVAIGVLLPAISIDFFINLFLIGTVYSMIYSLIYVSLNPKRGMFSSIKGSIKILSVAFIGSILFAFYFFQVTSLSMFPALIILLVMMVKFARVVEKDGFVRKVPVRKLKVDDMIADDLPKLKISKKIIRGLTEKEVMKIKKMRKYVHIKDGVRFGLVFPITLMVTLLFGNLVLLFLPTFI